MIIVGLTGGIGSGKSTVAKMFKELGVPVYNSDKEAKKLMKSSKKVKKAIMELLGEDAYQNEKINKPFIANKIFNDKGLLQKMNAIVHPAVKKHFLKWVDKQETPYVIQETALIFENDNTENYDLILLVTAPVGERIARVVKRDGISRSKVEERMNNQLSDDFKAEKSDYTIENSDIEHTKIQVSDIYNRLLKHSETC